MANTSVSKHNRCYYNNSIKTDLFSASIENLQYVELGIFVVALFILRKFKANAITIILGSGVVGTVIYCLMELL